MLDEQVSDDDRSTLFSFLARGAGQGYAPQSGEIIGIPKQLMAAQKEEEDRKANNAGLIAAKKEEIATLTATIETKLTQQVTSQLRWRASRMTWPTRRGPWPLTRSWPPSSPKVVGVGGAPGEQGWRRRALCESRTSRKTHALFSGWLLASATSSDRLSCDSHGALCTS